MRDIQPLLTVIRKEFGRDFKEQKTFEINLKQGEVS